MTDLQRTSPGDEQTPPVAERDGEGSGHPAVEAAVAAVAAAAELPLREQVVAYEDAHRTLQETLATIDES
ncbi:MAG TPA: hypothetical protein VF462_13120 [Micromonosporaceae bacterium]